MVIHATTGTTVRFWTGLREGEGRIGKIKYDGVYELGGTHGVYIGAVEGRSIGFVALSHVEEIEVAGATAPGEAGKEQK